MKDNDPKNAGVKTGRIKFCDLRCEHAAFPDSSDVDGSRSCRTYLALWCRQLDEYVTRNAPCAVIFGKRRPKAGW
ncbi:MAG: hypothetical protein WAN36_02940 [Calditrichia bacterium]